jgi:hypothetical protein
LTPGPRACTPPSSARLQAGKHTLLLTPPRARTWPGRRCQPATRTRPAAITPSRGVGQTPTG